jgi:hypothetical protein
MGGAVSFVDLVNLVDGMDMVDGVDVMGEGGSAEIGLHA